MFKNILVGYDGSKGGKAALRRAAAFAKEGDADITTSGSGSRCRAIRICQAISAITCNSLFSNAT